MDGRTRSVANLARASAHLLNIFSETGVTRAEMAGDPERFDGERLSNLAGISLYTAIGGLEMVIYADDEAAGQCIAALFGGCSDLEDARARADAVGELANMVMGRIKHEVLEVTGIEHAQALPRLGSLAASSAMPSARDLPAWRQAVRFPGSAAQLWVVWRERNTAALTEAAIELIKHPNLANDICARHQLLSLSEEMREAIPEEDSARIALADGVVEFMARWMRGGDSVSDAACARVRTVLDSLLVSARQDLRARGLFTVDPMLDASHRERASYMLDLECGMGELMRRFAVEMREELGHLDDCLARLSGSGYTVHDLEVCLRILHHVAASSGLLGLDELHRLAAATESILAPITAGRSEWGQRDLDVLDQSIRLLYEVLDGVDQAIAGDGVVQSTPSVDAHIELISDELNHDAGPSGRVLSLRSTPRGPGSYGLSRSSVLLRSEAIEELVEIDRTLGRIEVDLGDRADHLVSTLGEVRERVVRIYNEACLVRAKPVLRRVARHCRDLIRQHQQIVRIRLGGEDVVLPRRIAEGVGEVLCHIVEQSIVYGIEDYETREKLGKDLLATLAINVVADGDRMIFTVEDDGRGMPELPYGSVEGRALTERSRAWNGVFLAVETMGGTISGDLPRAGGMRVRVEVPVNSEEEGIADDDEDDGSAAQLTMMVL